MNYARFYIGEYFEDVDDYIYIDTDMVVFGDISEIWNIYTDNKTNERYFAPVLLDNIQLLLSPKLEYKQLYNDFIGKGFNAGIYITSSKMWLKYKIFEKILELIKNTKGHFNFGTQPILNLIFYGKIIELPIEWNICAHICKNNIEKINKICNDFNRISIDVNLLSFEYIKENRIKLLHYAGPSVDKFWTIDNFKKYRLNGNRFMILNTLYSEIIKNLYIENLDISSIELFYHYLKQGYKIVFTDNINDV